MSSSTTAPTEGLTEPSDLTEKLGKRERNKLDKQRRIMEAATELFEKKGFEATTTAEIASKAGIGAGTLYLYVGSKEDLLVSVFAAVAGDAWSQAFERVDRAKPVVEQVTELFLNVTDHHEHDRRLARSFFRELPWVEAPARQVAEEFVGDFLDRIEVLLTDACGSGQLDPEVPRRTLAANLYALWVHEMRGRASGRQSYDETAAQVREAFRLALWRMTPETS